MENLAEAFLRLSKEDFAVLSAIGTGMRDYEWVPITEISQGSGLTRRKVQHRLSILIEQKLASRKILQYEGYQIGFNAYDLLALLFFVKHDFVNSIGDKIGVGKESVVYDALGETPLVIKFHRQGCTSFKHVRRLRNHLAELPRVHWLHAASLAARHEFQIMAKLHPLVSVPRPVSLSRNAIAMELVPGQLLNKITLSNPKECISLIIEEVRKAYHQGIVHADLSEFNIIVTKEGLRIIDWPQAVGCTDPSAIQFLKRDLSNVLRFFARRYKISIPVEKAESLVKLPLEVV